MASSVVAGRDLTKRYGEGDAAVNALRGVSIEIAPGTFTAIMGPSGSGKSTLMHVLAGLDRPTEGTVDIDGTEIGKLDDGDLTRLRRDKIGFVFQAFNLVPVLTAEENIRLPLTLAGRDDAGGRVARLLEAVALTDRKTHRPNELSGGQRQRVAIARALVNHPSILLADEPTGALDTATSYDIMNLFEKLYEDGNTIILVTHEHDIAARARRIISIRDGLIEKDEDSDKKR